MVFFFWCCAASTEHVEELGLQAAVHSDEHFCVRHVRGGATEREQVLSTPSTIPTLLLAQPGQAAGDVKRQDPLAGASAGAAAARSAAGAAEETPGSDSDSGGSDLGAFGRRAAEGVPCTHVSAAGARVPATYRVDQRRGRVVVTAAEGGARGAPDIVVPISAVEDIYQIADGDDCFPLAVLAALRPGEREGLFCLVFAPPGGEAQSLCLVEGSARDRDLLLELLSVLSEGPGGEAC